MLPASEQRAMLVEEIQQYTKEIKANGTWVKGSRSQLVLNPALSARRAALEALRKLDAQNPAEEVSALDEFLEEESEEK